jgi:hypothetical protein
MRRYIAIALLLAACHKSNPTPTPAFNVSADINNIPTTFNAIISVDTRNTPLKTGTYPNTDTASGPNSSIGILGYTLWSDSISNFVQYFAINDTVTLTKVTRTWFSGTFQGTCEYSPDSIVSITNGQFTVGYPQQ